MRDKRPQHHFQIIKQLIFPRKRAKLLRAPTLKSFFPASPSLPSPVMSRVVKILFFYGFKANRTIFCFARGSYVIPFSECFVVKKFFRRLSNALHRGKEKKREKEKTEREPHKKSTSERKVS